MPVFQTFLECNVALRDKSREPSGQYLRSCSQRAFQKSSLQKNVLGEQPRLLSHEHVLQGSPGTPLANTLGSETVSGSILETGLGKFPTECFRKCLESILLTELESVPENSAESAL